MCLTLKKFLRSIGATDSEFDDSQEQNARFNLVSLRCKFIAKSKKLDIILKSKKMEKIAA